MNKMHRTESESEVGSERARQRGREREIEKDPIHTHTFTQNLRVCNKRGKMRLKKATKVTRRDVEEQTDEMNLFAPIQRVSAGRIQRIQILSRFFFCAVIEDDTARR